MSKPISAAEFADPYAPDGRYAYARLALSLLIATIIGAGMWAVIVVLPQAQLEFGVDRAAASLPYTSMMFGFAFGTIVLGRMADRTGIAVPLVLAGASLGLGFVLAGLAPNLFVFSAAHASADRRRHGRRLCADDGGRFALVRQAARAGGGRRGVGQLSCRRDLAAVDELDHAGDRLARDLYGDRRRSSPSP